MPKISVIVPVYNAEHTLARCIDSILAQSFHDFELILIDDGSMDSSGVICDEYATRDVRIKVFHKTNGGASSARNIGIDNASGEWVTFCDSDDWVMPGWLHNFIVHKDHIDIDMVCQGICFDYSKLYNHPYCTNVGIQYQGNTISFLEQIFAINIVGYTVIKAFRISIIKCNNLRFDERLRFREDEEFVLKYMAFCTNVYSCDSASYNYIVPDFNKKYSSVQNSYDLYASLYSSARKIVSKEFSIYKIKQLNDLTSCFMANFSNETRYHQMRRHVLNYRRIVGEDILLLNIFFLTKYLIFIDFTGVLSTILLSMQLRVKSQLGNRF